MNTTTSAAICIIGLLAASSFRYIGTQQDRVINDRDIKLVNFEDLAYPTLGRTAHVQGVVVLRVKLDDQGKVADAIAISGAEALIPDSLANAKKWRFQPNAQNAAVIVYNFRLTGWISKSGCSQFMLEPPNFATITGCVSQIQ